MNIGPVFGIFLRGVCMGIADLIPGVSGGTIAFISGIYQRLIAALAVFSQWSCWQMLLRGHYKRWWRETDAAFLCALAAGILCAILLFSKVLYYWLENQPHLLLGFFFGLVIASIVTVSRHVSRVGVWHIVLAAAAAAITFYVVTAVSFDTAQVGLPALFGGGMIAICAMLLPGISGSYILLILGLYPTVIGALHARDAVVVLVFAAGCGTGLLLFARVLLFLLRQYYSVTMLILLGVMVGALPKLWPWKEAGEGIKIILQANVMPAQFTGEANVPAVALLALAGMALILAVDAFQRRRQRASSQ